MSATDSTTLATCPICAGTEIRPHLDKPAHGAVWHIRRCAACGHGFVANPPPLERLNAIQAALEADTSGSAAGERLAPPRIDDDTLTFARRIASLTPARGETLDVGCGDGSPTLSLSLAGFKPHLLIDFDPRAASTVDHIPNSRFERIAFESMTRDAYGPFDAIIMSHVLEHALRPLAWLMHARQLLGPRGVLAIAIPNFGGVYRLMGARDPFIIPPVHLQYFTPSSMRRALEASGLEPLRMESRSAVTLQLLTGRLSLPGRILRRTWNAGAIFLNRTTRGIVLWAFARRAS